MKLAVVTASVDPDATRQFWGSWRQRAHLPWDLVMVHNAPGAGSGTSEVPVHSHVEEGHTYPGGSFIWAKYDTVMGPVPSFWAGISQAAMRGADIIACLHDDLRIDEDGWDAKVVQFFYDHPQAGLLGFGGAKGFGEEGIYQHPYDKMDLVRKDFVSNMEGAEAHGRRVTEPTQVACLDGFSQIGRMAPMVRWFRHLKNLGVVHHAYDSALGAYFHADHYEAWMLPIQCHHAGGRTAVLSKAYHEWLAARRSSDATEHEVAHRILYEDLRGYGVLPLRVE